MEIGEHAFSNSSLVSLLFLMSQKGFRVRFKLPGESAPAAGGIFCGFGGCFTQKSRCWIPFRNVFPAHNTSQNPQKFGKIPPKIGILHFKFSRHFTLTFRNLGQPRREGTWNENQHSDALIKLDYTRRARVARRAIV